MSDKPIQSKKNRILHILTISIFVILVCALAFFVIFKYQVEGEKNAVFDISKILVVSTVEGISKDAPTAKWDLNINQNNDVYITVEKNGKKQDAIKNVTINNVQIESAPIKGKINLYKPAETGLFKNNDKYKIENELIYTGSKEGSINNLEISNQGGTVIIRFCNSNICSYISNEDEQISHDGTLLTKAGINLEEIKAKVSFDVIIETESGIKYKTTVNLDLPSGNILEEATSTTEINTEDLVLKRF